MSMSDNLVGGFNATIHASNRLRICALLDAVAEAEFSVIQCSGWRSVPPCSASM